MNPKIVIPTAFISFAAALYAFKFLGSEIALMERYPDEDPDVIIKAHRKMFLAIATGKLVVDTTEEAVMDSIFEKFIEKAKQ